MNQISPQSCERFVHYLNDPAQCLPNEILTHIESCPSCLAAMISHQEAGRDLFMEAKYNRELALARKLYRRQISVEESFKSLSQSHLSSI